jgi:putative ABC transport system permease protein
MIRPPRIAVWLVERRVSKGEREFALGDLEEEFAVVCHDQGRAAARRWYWRQAIRVVLAPRRWRQTAPGSEGTGAGLVESVLHDLRLSFRSLRMSPGFAVLAVLTLAVGMGSSAAMFGAVKTVLLRPLGLRDPDRLMLLWPRNLARSIDKDLATPGLLNDWRAENHAFSELAHATDAVYTLTGHGAPQSLIAWQISGNFLRVLGARPAMGRGFSAADEQPGHHRVVLLSNRVWRDRFGGDAGVIGRSLALNDQPYTVVGVMPKEFAFPHDVTDIWTPLGIPPEVATSRTLHRLRVVGRLRDGVTIREAEVDMGLVSRRLGERYPDTDAGWDVALQPVRDLLVGDIRSPLLALAGAVAFLLLIACANVANLLVVRAMGRRREVALRIALGASRGRVVRQLLTETLALSGLGCALGLGLAVWLARVLVTLIPAQIANLSIPMVQHIPIDRSVVLFSCLLAGVTGLFLGTVPALQLSGMAPGEDLKGATGRMTGTQVTGRIRSALVVVQLALALVLLAGAGVMIKSFARLQASPLGFNPDRVLTMHVTLPRTRYRTDADRRRFVNEAIARMRAVPGVTSAAAVNFLPLSGFWDTLAFKPPHEPPAPVAQWPQADSKIASEDYFRTLQIPILRGRGFGPQDVAEGQAVCLINGTLARRYFPGRNPVGLSIDVDPDAVGTGSLLVIGVVADAKHFGAAEQARPEVYRPFSQAGFPIIAFAVRTDREPMTLVDPVREAVWSVDSAQAITRVLTLADAASESTALRRTGTVVVGCFAVAALALAALGVYGVVSFLVVQRTRELGIRAVLGARRSDILRFVLREHRRATLLGLAIGVTTAAAATRTLGAFLFEVGPLDPAVFAWVAALLTLVCLAASWIPARRAARMHPVEALRQ